MKTKKVVLGVFAVVALLVAGAGIGSLAGGNMQGNLFKANQQEVSVKSKPAKGVTNKLPATADMLYEEDCFVLQEMINAISAFSGVGVTPVLRANPSLASEIYSKINRCNTAYPNSIVYFPPVR